MSFCRYILTSLVVWFPDSDSETFSWRRDPTTAPGSGDRVLGCALVDLGLRVKGLGRVESRVFLGPKEAYGFRAKEFWMAYLPFRV